MSTVRVRNPATLQHALAHHARALQPIVGALTTGILVELLPLGWELRQSGVGAKSYSIRKDGREYHFRPARRPGIKGITAITVLDSWFNGRVVATLTGRVDALRFIAERVAES